jgi:matrix metalloproteinase-25 (membrane-inserted)
MYFLHQLNYLTRFGYLDQSTPAVGNLMSEQHVENAIRTMQVNHSLPVEALLAFIAIVFQRFGGVPESGRLDPATRMLMSKPRCGIPDMESGRTKRYVKSSNIWKKTNLTWRLIFMFLECKLD